jgi:hypothetical protein
MNTGPWVRRPASITSWPSGRRSRPWSVTSGASWLRWSDASGSAECALLPLAPRARVLGITRGTLRVSPRELGLTVRESVEEDEGDAIVPGEPTVALRASVGSTDARKSRARCFGVVAPKRTRSPQGKPDEVVQTPAAKLSGRAASRATNIYAVRASEIVPTRLRIRRFGD